jgi:circadian clock protein KaiC
VAGPRSLLATGVPNLDLILGGGIVRQDLLLIVGPAGTGKTTLGLPLLFAAAARVENGLCVSTVSEPAAKLVRHIRSYAYYDEPPIGKRIFFLSAYPLLRRAYRRCPTPWSRR